MTRISKISLALSIIALAVSFTEAGGNFGWGILRPFSAVAFIVFFITNLLAKEVALYDAEESAKLKQVEAPSNTVRRKTQSPGSSRLSPA